MLSGNSATGYMGGLFEDYLVEHGIDPGNDHVIKAKLSWQFDRARKTRGLTKSEFARLLGTSRSQLDRLLDPNDHAVMLSTLQKAAETLGHHLEVVIVVQDSMSKQ